MMMLVLWGISNLMVLIALLVRRKMRRSGTGRRKGLIYAQVGLATLVLATAFWMSCDTSYLHQCHPALYGQRNSNRQLPYNYPGSVYRHNF